MNKVTRESRLLHGGDYNPDQWLNYPDILEQDIELMKQSKTNTFSVGIFGWATLEPEEGKFNFEWLDDVFERIHSFGGNVILATPSGARPAWMSQEFPEVLRVDENRNKQLHGGRHNHCYTSPYYRKKTHEINLKLAERYGHHPALLMWHVSNEYGGECHCDLCQEAFRNWLKEKYDNELNKLNHAWWGPFWSHTFTDWSQIESPSPIGENAVHGLNLDWKRFVTHQTIDFYKNEILSLREITPQIPITTNFMGNDMPFRGLDYSQFAKEVDVISWDAYPKWHNDYEETWETASKVGFLADSFKSLKQKPWLLLESTPSGVNWHPFNKTKRPGMHLLSGMQMLAHGSDSNLYFQWRKSRGSSEKFHGAVIDHDGSTDNRVFKEVSMLGKTMEDISEKVVGGERRSEVAILYDWESDWALEDTQGFAQETKQYPETLQKHYQAFWKKDIPVDVITKENAFNQYKILIIPMLYMVSEETIKRLKDYVTQGGILISSYMTGLVNEHDLTYLGGWHPDLKELFGIEPLETDTYYPKDENHVEYNGDTYTVKDYATIIKNEKAEVLGHYLSDFYAQTPAVTKHAYEKGLAYYVGARLDEQFNDDFYNSIIKETKLSSILESTHKTGVSIQGRVLENSLTVFIMNFTEEVQEITLYETIVDCQSKEELKGELSLQPYEVKVVEKPLIGG